MWDQPPFTPSLPPLWSLLSLLCLLSHQSFGFRTLKILHSTEAIKILHSVLVSRRHRNWTKTHEAIMIKLMDLCVKNRQPHMAKECLHQYRNITQTQAPHSLEVVIDHMLSLAEKYVKNAAKHSESTVVEHLCDDLEAERSPEAVLLSAVTTDDASNRADRELLTPWLRFLWESFRTVLEILKNNNRLENVYHGTCARAVKFCLKYNRKTEFRRLADMVRIHLATLQKYQNQPQEKRRSYAITLGPAVYERHVATRFEMLTGAAALDMWAEGFRIVEDLHSIMSLTMQEPKVKLMATYFEKLTQVCNVMAR